QGYNGTGNVLTDSNATTITITSVNDSPVIGAISDQATNQGTITSSISFTITDAESGVLTVSCSSSDAAIVSSTSFDIGQTGANSYTTSISAAGTASVSMTIMPSATGTGVATITAMVTDSSGVTATSQFDLTVYDIPTVSWASATQTITETSTTLSIPLNLSAASGQPVSVSYTITGTATSGDDYSYTTTSITIPAGDLEYSVSVTINNNNTFEGDETIILTITSAVNAVAEGITLHEIIVEDDADQPSVNWSSSTYSSIESATSVSLTAIIDSISEVDTYVAYSVTGGTATGNNGDYSLSSGVITISAGVTSATVTCGIVDDGTDENSETIIVSFVAYTNSIAGSTVDCTITIEDDDNPPSVSFSPATYSETEGAGTVTITATLSLASEKAISVDYDLTGGTATASDYTFTSNTLTFAAGVTTQTFTCEINDDTLDESTETIIFGFGSYTNVTIIEGASSNYELSIGDNDDPPTVSWNVSTISVNENAGTQLVTATLVSVSGQDVFFSYTVTAGTATSDTDYTYVTGDVVITAGSTTSG
ncbi:hypothetical protein MHK_002907, partial [Candidatus Magnetomorum sp. HK-1]